MRLNNATYRSDTVGRNAFTRAPGASHQEPVVAIDDHVDFVERVFDDVVLIDLLDLPSVKPDERARCLAGAQVGPIAEERRQVVDDSVLKFRVVPGNGPKIQRSQCSVSVRMSRRCCSGISSTDVPLSHVCWQVPSFAADE
jgi:hypothetical protein